MPCGPQLIEEVSSHLSEMDGTKPINIRDAIGIWDGKFLTIRVIRYAISELIKQGRARRQGAGRQTRIYAVKNEPAAYAHIIHRK